MKTDERLLVLVKKTLHRRREGMDVRQLSFILKYSISSIHTVLQELVRRGEVEKYADGIVVKYKPKKPKLKKRTKAKLLKRRCKHGKTRAS